MEFDAQYLHSHKDVGFKITLWHDAKLFGLSISLYLVFFQFTLDIGV